MKILMTSDTYLPRVGGGEYHVMYLSRELRKMGHHVTMLTTESGIDSNDELDCVLRVPYKNLVSLFSIFFILWQQSRDVDVVHSHYSYRLGCVAAIVARLRGKRLILTQHGLGLLPQVGSRGFYEIVFRLWRYSSMFLAHRIISTSHDLSLEIRALGFGSKIVHIPNGYDDAFFIPLPVRPVSGPSLLSVRRFTPKTGIQYVIQALPELKRYYPNIRYTAIGDGPTREKLELLSQELGVNDVVTFAGALRHNDLLKHYENADVVLLPSTAESTSLSCIEAMAMERVIVASRVGGLVELIGADEQRGTLATITETEHSCYDASPLLRTDHLSALVHAIRLAIDNRHEAEEKARAASIYAKQHFAWKIIAARTVAESYMLCDTATHS